MLEILFLLVDKKKIMIRFKNYIVLFYRKKGKFFFIINNFLKYIKLYNIYFFKLDLLK